MMVPRDGLPDPETAVDERDSQSIAGMRRAIEKGAGTSGLIRQCFMVAKNQGLTGEEIYLLLAYQALRRLEAV